MAAPTPKTSGTATAAFTFGAISVTPAEAATAAAGDGLLVLAVCSSANTLSMTGWTTIMANTVVGGVNIAIWGIANRGSSAPSTTVTCSAVDYIEANLYQWSGGDTTSPFVGFTTVNNSGSTNPDPPSTGVVASADYLAICGCVNWDTGGAWVAPTGYSNKVDINLSAEDNALASKQLTAATSEDPGAWSGGIGASTACWAFTILIKPASAGSAGNVAWIRA